jgi:serine-type D-Ala-D-Ala carboxypeptidase (penicillin-binding protein 5/6)
VLPSRSVGLIGLVWLLLAPAGALAVPADGSQLGSTGVVVDSRPGVPSLPKGVTASAWLVADDDTGAVLAARDAHGRFPPASLAKVLAALTLIPRLNPAQVVRPTNAELRPEQPHETLVGLVPSQTYTVDQLFSYFLVASGNDAGRVLEQVGGGRPVVAAEMNAEAARLGARDTVAVNADGLDAPGQVTSAYDLAVITRAALALPAFRRYVAARAALVPGKPGQPPFQVQNHNKSLYNVPGAIGVKNGYTVAAQATDVAAVTRGGHTLLVVLLHSPPRYWPESAALADWGFAALARAQPVGTLVPDTAPSPPIAGSGEPAASPAASPARLAGLAATPRSGSPYRPLVFGGGAVMLSLLVLGLWSVRRKQRHGQVG